jgi:hypothetical protein
MERGSGRKTDLTEEQLAGLINSFWRRQGLRANARVEVIKGKVEHRRTRTTTPRPRSAGDDQPLP